MNRFEEKVVVVTGAGTGIGRAVAQRFAKEGAKVLILGRTENTLKETAEADEDISYVVADIEKDEDIEKVVSEVKREIRSPGYPCE